MVGIKTARSSVTYELWNTNSRAAFIQIHGKLFDNKTNV